MIFSEPSMKTILHKLRGLLALRKNHSQKNESIRHKLGMMLNMAYNYARFFKMASQRRDEPCTGY